MKEKTQTLSNIVLIKDPWLFCSYNTLSKERHAFAAAAHPGSPKAISKVETTSTPGNGSRGNQRDLIRWHVATVIGFNCIESWYLTNKTGKHIRQNQRTKTLQSQCRPCSCPAWVQCLNVSKNWVQLCNVLRIQQNLEDTDLSEMRLTEKKNLAKYKTSPGHLTAQGGGSLGLKAKWQSKRYFGTPFLLIGLLCQRFHVHLTLNLWPSGLQKLQSFTSFAHFAEWRKQFARQWTVNGSHAQNTADSRLLQHARIGARSLSNINKLPWHCGLLETLHGTLLAA